VLTAASMALSLAVWCTHTVFALDSADSLRAALASARYDTTRVQLLNKLSNELRNRNPDSALLCAKEALRIAEASSYTSGLGRALVNMGNVYRNLGDYHRALECLNRALNIAEQSHNMPLMTNALNGIGVVYIRQGSHDLALEPLLRSLRLADSIDDKRAAASALDNIGIIYLRQGNDDKAASALFRSLALAESLGDKRISSIALNDLGIMYRSRKLYDSALLYYGRSLAIKRELRDKQGSALTMNGIGITYRNQGKFDAALGQFFGALQLQEELRFQPGIATALSDIAQTYLQQNKYRESIVYAERCINVARTIGAKADLRNAYHTLAEAHDQSGNQARAFAYFRLYAAMKDSIFNEDIARKSTELSAYYDNEVREKQIRLLERDRKLQRLELEQKNLLLATLTSLGVLVLMSVILLVRQIRERRRSEVALRRQNEEILRQQHLLKEQSSALEAAYAESERLLANTLPLSIVERLKRGESTIADRLDSVTVLFADIVGFSSIATQSSPEDLVQMLDSIFSDIDGIANTYTLEKIKTIGDCYMLTGGLFETSHKDMIPHAERVAQAALAIHHTLKVFQQATGLPLAVRIGIHIGPVVAGIIGKKRFAYDLWGDTVNIASRMESHGEAGKIHCSEDVYAVLSERFVFEERGTIDVKGKGRMKTYFLVGQR